MKNKTKVVTYQEAKKITRKRLGQSLDEFTINGQIDQAGEVLRHIGDAVWLLLDESVRDDDRRKAKDEL